MYRTIHHYYLTPGHLLTQETQSNSNSNLAGFIVRISMIEIELWTSRISQSMDKMLSKDGTRKLAPYVETCVVGSHIQMVIINPIKH